MRSIRWGHPIASVASGISRFTPSQWPTSLIEEQAETRQATGLGRGAWHTSVSS